MLLLRLCAKGLTDISHSWVENLLLEFTLLMVVSKTRRGLRLSLKATPAHKCIKVKPSERGLAAFTWQGKAYRYKTCHFGATYSAYWWSRASAMIQRHIHILLLEVCLPTRSGSGREIEFSRICAKIIAELRDLFLASKLCGSNPLAV